MTSETSRFDGDYFERNYRDYDRQNPARKLEFYRRLVERHAPAGRKPRLLDMGCAFGAFLGSLDPTWERFGSDVSEFAIDRARSTIDGVSFRVGSAVDPAFEGPFDVITAFDVIEHVPDLDRVAAAVKSRLRLGGRFVFLVPVYDGFTGPLVRLLDEDPTHVHKRSRDFWLEWTASSFDLLDWQGVFRYLLPGGYYAHLPTRRLRRAAPAIAVVAGNRSE